ncbi:MAG: exosome complex RNA-binding protein Rrp4 [archaeon]
MKEIKVNDKDIVVPGEELAVGMDYIPSTGTYRDGDKIIAAQLGIVNISGRVIKLIPLSGRYMPKAGDMVIGKVMNMSFSNWAVDIGYAYEAMVSLKDATSEFIERGADLSKYFDFGDIVAANIVNVTRSNAVDLSMKGPGLHKLKGGKLVFVTPSKVPRIIGKQASMINLIKEKTGCKITVGQNGWVWIQSDDPKKEMITTKVIEYIDENAHKNGLTDDVSKMLAEELK